jgi:rod shape-determining protein MreC
MKGLFHFLYRYRAFIIFVCLEIISAVLIISHKTHDAAVRDVVGGVQNFINEARNYPFLKRENAALLHENATLREQLLQVVEPAGQLDAPISYHFIAAKVINNTIVGTKNYLTLNKGAIHGVAPGMGVVSAEGIVGRVKAVSSRFATVTSLLHIAMQVSAQVSKSKVLGTVQWAGHDPCRAQLVYVPRHILVEPGDRVVTSGYSTTFPEGVWIGHIERVNLRKEAPYYDIELRLSTDFSTLQNVYVARYTLKEEKDFLEEHTRGSHE